MSVVHSHSINVIPFAITKNRLKPVFHMSGFLGEGSAQFEIRVDAQRELIPQFDVEHVAETEAGQVRINIRTWRRNISVEVFGSDVGVNDLNAQMALAALMA